MGIILSVEERTQFLQAIKVAQEVGWSRSIIAQGLKVSSSDFKRLCEGNLSPSTKHVTRLNTLLRNGPPKSVPPPSTNGHTPEAAQASEAPPTEDPPSETTTMNHTEMNGTSNASQPHAKKSLLNKATSKDVRAGMQVALAERFGGSMREMAKAIGITDRGLGRLLHNKQGRIESGTMERFASVTGWTRKATQASRAEQRATTPPRARRNDLLPDELLLPFREELRRETESNTVRKLAKSLHVTPWAIKRVLNGNGTSYKMLAKFDKYKKRGPTMPQEVKPSARPVPIAVAPKKAEAVIEAREGRIHPDLYEMSGRLLARGKTKEAHVLGLLALAIEEVPIEQISLALTHLRASTG